MYDYFLLLFFFFFLSSLFKTDLQSCEWFRFSGYSVARRLVDKVDSASANRRVRVDMFRGLVQITITSSGSCRKVDFVKSCRFQYSPRFSIDHPEHKIKKTK